MENRKHLKICLVSREYPVETGWGGIGAYTYNLAHGLADMGHQVHVIALSLDDDKEYYDNKVFVHRICHRTFFLHKYQVNEFALRLEYSYRVYKTINDLTKRYGLDIIEGPNLAAETFVYSFFKKIPVVIRMHSPFSSVIKFCGWPMTFDRRLSCWLEDATILRSDLVVTSTRAHAEKMFQEIGSKPGRVEIIPLGINIPSLNEIKVSKFSATPTVLYLGRIEPRKGVHILIKAVPYIVQEIPSINFIFIGRDTYISDGQSNFSGNKEYSFKEKIIRSIPECYLKNIQFLGFVEDSKLPEYIKTCDLFVAPSLYESFGLIYIEAMSYGKSVIGCNVGGIPEVVKDEVTGLLVPPNDPVALADAIIKLLKDKDRRIEMGRKAREHVESNFTRERMVEKTIEAYEKLL